MTRAVRRHHVRRAKAKAKRLILNVWRMRGNMSPEQVERKAAKLATYRVCSCCFCRPPKYERSAEWRATCNLEE